ncbi:Gfo/Idh/MocA family oxidoreductase [Pontiellaceae bacterium B1224]|nr:Gfo/Idh/MocA family oxidoreductase [Pontiellaceae bacterium B1224]
MSTIQWGIIGCGSIANLFARSLKTLPEGTLLAGASRTPGRAEEFAQKHGMERVYTDYDALLADPDIDAVYVATTHNFHYDNVKQCLESGKHVLCEKPFTINAAQTQELIDLAREKNCFLMEAMWTRFLPAIVKMQELLAEGVIGEVQAVRADFCVGGNEFSKDHRMCNKALAGGALLDLGVYPITFADIVFNAVPTRIQSSAFIGETDVDDRSFYQLDYPGGRFAQLSSSFTHVAPNDAFVFGSKGFIRVPMFWMTKALEINLFGEEPEMLPLPYGDGEHFKFEIDHAMQCINAGKLESDIHPLSKTKSIMQTMDTLRAQWGLEYPADQ